jgi:hypothetical protein
VGEGLGPGEGSGLGNGDGEGPGVGCGLGDGPGSSPGGRLPPPDARLPPCGNSRIGSGPPPRP